MIRKQVMSMVTDTQRILRTDPGRPEVCNVCQLQRFFGDDYEELWDGERTARTGCVDMKRAARRPDRRATTRPPASATSSCRRSPERVDEILAAGADRLAPAGRRDDGRGPPEDGPAMNCRVRPEPMGFELTPRERRWFDAILVLGAFALGFIVLGFVGVIFAFFGDLIMVFFLAWLLAFMLGPVVNRVYSIPFMSRTGAIFTVYFLLFGWLVVVSIVVAAALVRLDPGLHRRPARRCARTCRRSSRRGRSA